MNKTKKEIEKIKEHIAYLKLALKREVERKLNNELTLEELKILSQANGTVTNKCSFEISTSQIKNNILKAINKKIENSKKEIMRLVDEIELQHKKCKDYKDRKGYLKMNNKEKIKYIDCRLSIDEKNKLRICYDNYTKQVLDFEGNQHDAYADLKYVIQKGVLNKYFQQLKEKQFDEDDISVLVKRYKITNDYKNEVSKLAQKRIDDGTYYVFYKPTSIML